MTRFLFLIVANMIFIALNKKGDMKYKRIGIVRGVIWLQYHTIGKTHVNSPILFLIL